MRKITRNKHLLIIYDSEYPVCYKILKSGHSDCYSVIEEDPFEHDLKLKSREETLSLIRLFDPDFNEQNLPTELGVEHDPNNSDK